MRGADVVGAGDALDLGAERSYTRLMAPRGMPSGSIETAAIAAGVARASSPWEPASFERAPLPTRALPPGAAARGARVDQSAPAPLLELAVARGRLLLAQ